MINNKISLSVLVLTLGIVPFAHGKNLIHPWMVNIPAGEFVMGTNSGDKAAQPAHSVKVSAFQLAKHPVTVAEFRLFIQDTHFPITNDCDDKLDKNWLSGPTSVGTASWDNHRYLKSEYQPVTCITPKLANAYVDWLNDKTRGGYRLPTEQEFEYALKANSTSRYHWGDDADQACMFGNFADQSGEYFPNEQFGASYVGFIGHANCNDGEPYISIVGLYRPNGFGLHDMESNTSQLLGSCYYDGYQARTEQNMDINQCEYISQRGSTWHYPPQPAYDRGRYKRAGWSPGAMMGFRLARTTQSDVQHESTEGFKQALKKAQHMRLATRAMIPSAPKNVHLVNLQDNAFELRWQAHYDGRVIGYDIYRSILPNAHLLGGYYKEHYEKVTSVPHTRFSNNVTLSNHGGSFRVVAKTNKLASLPSVAAVHYDPELVTIPGRFDMRSVATLTNVWARHQAATKEKPERFYITTVSHLYEQPNILANFKINVKKTGWYTLNYKGSTYQNGTFFKLWQGDNLVAEVEFDSNIDEKTANRHEVYLEQGRHQLQISVKREGFDYWSLGWLEFLPSKN
ncbi:Hercynine oxygenase [Pseudoalteromonas holothuriae]|uniref:Hercynine oxygenase n=1 Tax=Pseudoalteromonas holothuriae TaxID=2963714 RepID=A0ABM9GDN7_9GAMM|nr:SUMF1/EgtB/PvdO family nonheme iron enzyme [Pseudoalteromonas sp. CIP111951]CAH9051230.1 Hercynine oxygenase [Pseudoalteromonas sp. CIP111951]